MSAEKQHSRCQGGGAGDSQDARQGIGNAASDITR